ncbi:MAG: hypothetical protein ACT4O1_16750 [Gemmatimonadota bacterium]
MYGENLSELMRAPRERKTELLVLRKERIPPLVVRKKTQRWLRAPASERGPLRLERPIVSAPAVGRRSVLSLLDDAHGKHILRATGDALEIEAIDDALDTRSAAQHLAAVYRLSFWEVFDELSRIYGEAAVPLIELEVIAGQIEVYLGDYARTEEEVEVALALVRLDETDTRRGGWQRRQLADGEAYVTEITYLRDRERFLMRVGDSPGDFGYHYAPYNFDSNPEMDFFRRMLQRLGQHPDEVEDIYFTGALTDPRKTDFFVEYKGADERTHRYSPDFVIRRKDGGCLIVEIKSAQQREHPVDGA